MNKAVRRTALVCGASLVLILSGCSTGGTSVASSGPPPAPVKVAQAQVKTIPIEIRTIGNVEAYKTISVKSQVTGVLTQVHFQEGAPVRHGQLLFEIDARPYKDAQRQIEANLARDNSLLEQAEAALARDVAEEKFYREQARRYDVLTKKGVFSRQQNDQAVSDADAHRESVRADEAAIESLRSSIEADRASLENAKVQLEYCYLYAPVDGQSGNIGVKEGNLVKANDVELVTINQIQPVYVTFTLPEKHLAVIRERNRAGRLTIRAVPQGDTEHAEEGVLTFINNAVDQASGTIKLKGTFRNNPTRLWPGQFVDVVLTLGQRRNVIAIPSRAVQVGQSGNFVYVVKPDLTVELRPVTPGDAAGGLVEIQQGIQPGETVVTEGHIRLAPGARVRVQS